MPDKVPLQAGEVSAVEVRAPRDATYVDDRATEAVRLQHLRTVSSQYEVDVHAAGNAEAAVEQAFARVGAARAQMAGLPAAERVRRLRALLTRDLGLHLTPASAEVLLPVFAKMASGVPPKDVAKNLGVSIPTLYRWVPASTHA